MRNARDDLDLIVDKFAQQIVIASGEELNATHLTDAGGYLRRTPQVRRVDEHLQALEIIVKKDVNIYWIKNFTYKEYLERLDECFTDEYTYITQEEYDLVSKVVKEIGDLEEIKGDDTNG